ncbi:MAG: hypothetical protein GEU75_04230 [Dehalococcoidia bacterium]|nr:hypothetical protein [Dehalococcoidia bacterium]
MNEDPKSKSSGASKGGGSRRGMGGPPPNVRYGGEAQSVYTPPSRRESASGESSSGSKPTANKATSPKSPVKRQASSKSRYGSITPLKPLAKARIFESALTLNLDAKNSDVNGDWPMYISSQKLPDSADRSIVNGVYIHRSWLPTPLPEKIKVKFEPA